MSPARSYAPSSASCSLSCRISRQAIRLMWPVTSSTTSAACPALFSAGRRPPPPPPRQFVNNQYEQFGAPAVDLDGGQLVAAGAAPVDDGDRDAERCGMPHEPIAGEHRQRRARDQQRISLIDQ